jgi:MFS family permease
VGLALKAVLARAPATLGVSAMAIGQMVMSGVMAMTPVHIKSAGHDAAHTLRVVGVVLSFHIAGMYAFAPLMGWLTDRLGRRPVIFLGVVLLLGACVLAGTAGNTNAAQLSAGLMVLGLGWSACTVAGSTLLTESIPPELRASGQGLSDLVMGLAGATAGALSGAIVGLWSYAMLTLVAAIASVLMILGVGLFRLRQAASVALR